MTERLTLALHEPQQAHKALKHAWEHIKAWTLAGHRLVLTVRPETRSLAANRLLHSSIGDIAKQCEWAGRKWDTEVWKRLLTGAWMRARGDAALILPALDGQGVDVVVTRTSRLTRAECSELVDFIHAWGAAHDVQWSPASVAMGDGWDG